MWSSDLQAASLVIARDRCLDMVHRWLSVCGHGSCDVISQRLDGVSDEQLADQCIDRWRLDQAQGDDNDLTWFEEHDADRLMLIEAFAIVRSSLMANRRA